MGKEKYSITKGQLLKWISENLTIYQIVTTARDWADTD